MNNSPPFDLKLRDETTTPGEAACLLTDAKRIRPSMTSVVSAECNANGPNPIFTHPAANGRSEPRVTDAARCANDRFLG